MQTKKVLKVLKKNPLFTICLVIILLFILVAVFAPVLSKYDPYAQNLLDSNAPPSAEHLLGTDALGRDLLTRLMYGARVSLTVSLTSSLMGLLMGTTLGLISGYVNGIIGGFIMRANDALMSIPGLITAMVMSIHASGNLLFLAFVIAFTTMPTYIRIVYGQVLSLRENDYVAASKLLGSNMFEILIRHILPNCFGVLIVTFTMSLGNTILIEETMSYVGLGIKPPTPAWGVMVSEGYSCIWNNPALALIPGLCVVLMVVAFNVAGDGLRDLLDPRLRGKV